jgi:hypothetical protein
MFPFAEITTDVDKTLDPALKNFCRVLPGKLETKLINLSNGQLGFLDRSVLKKLQRVLNYRQPKNIVDSLRYIYPTLPNTIIFIKVDYEGTGKIIIEAKAIDVSDPNYGIILKKDITVITADINKYGDIKIHDLAKKMLHKDESIEFGVGLGFGYNESDQLAIGNLPSVIRTGHPHPDDVTYRQDEILDPNNPDNYLIIKNTVHVALKHRISLDVHFRFWGILNIAFQTSEIKGSEVIEGENLYRKSYIKEGSPGGDALIYYLIRSKNQYMFNINSFSLPIYITYPVFNLGENKETIFNLVGGTNLLLPDKVSFEAERGWHRFNEMKKETTFDLGDLTETNFFAGILIEGAFLRSIRFGLQLALVYTEYKEDFNFPLTLKQSNKLDLSLRLNISTFFDYD